MKQIILTIVLTLISLTTFSQRNRVPKNIDEAMNILQTDCPDSLKSIIRTTGNDSLIMLSYPWGGEYRTISNWTTGLHSPEKTKLEKYYAKLGIEYPVHVQKIVLISFKDYLNNGQVAHDEIIKPFQTVEKKWRQEDAVRFTTDTLRGVYIPMNLDDSFKQIDSFWDDSTKIEVKEWTEGEFIGKAHFGFGLWMRNNWQLWRGSRLSKYFNANGVYHPDDMSGIILRGYYRYLKGEGIELDELMKYGQGN